MHCVVHDCCSSLYIICHFKSYPWLTWFFSLHSFKVLPFFDNMFRPSSCQCGETIAFHPKMFLEYCKEQNRDTQGVTEAAIRSFIKQQKIGCTSNRIRFRGTGIQVSAVHIPRAWFDKDVINKFDEREYYVSVLQLFTNSLYMQWLANLTSEFNSESLKQTRNNHSWNSALSWVDLVV